MRIAIDAMGGDHAPREIVKGAVLAAAALPAGSALVLVGDEQAIRRELAAEGGGGTPAIEVLHASEVVGMEEPPALAVRRKKDSSIARAMDLVKRGEADAVVSAGNTGALMVSATLKLRMLPGVDRPAIATVLPTVGRPLVLIDAGANTDCAPRLLVQFAVMGAAYARVILGRASPVVGLVSIGGEDSKGNETTKEAFKLLSQAGLDFRGNIEGHDLFKGETDVAVCDGFVGNVVLKTTESVARAIGHWMKAEFTRNALRKIGALLLGGALRAMRERLDPEMYGGAPLLGVDGVCIKTHGSSSHRAVYHAVRVAREAVDRQLSKVIAAGVAGRGAAA